MSEPGSDGLALPKYRALRDMLELTRSILEDEHVSDTEARRLWQLMETHPGLLGVPAVEELLSHLRDYFSDGVLSERQRAELTRLLQDLAGEAA